MVMSTLRVSAAMARTSDILGQLKDGTRVTIAFDELREVTLRRSGETYYCDNGVRLVTYRTLSGMRECLEKLGIGDRRDDAE